MISNKAHRCALVLIVCVIVSCSNTIKGDMRRMLGKKVDISALSMEYPGDGKESLYRPKAPFKVIVYMDSLYCAECEIVKISVWNEHFNWFKSMGVPVYFVFNKNFDVDLYLELKRTGFKYPAFRDKGNRLRDSFYLSSFDALRTFLIKNDTIVALGNPILTSKVMDLYSKVITTQGYN